MTLTRQGDLDYTTAVRYVIQGDPASFQSPSDPSQEVVFHRGESSKELHIVLQANHEKNEEVDALIVKLVESRMLDNVSVPVRVGQLNRTVITIHNHDYRGPFFPDLPVVVNQGNPIVFTSLFYDLPLHCITVSDVIILMNVIKCFFVYICSHAQSYILPRGRDSTAICRAVLLKTSLRRVLCLHGRFPEMVSISQP